MTHPRKKKTQNKSALILGAAIACNQTACNSCLLPPLVTQQKGWEQLEEIAPSFFHQYSGVTCFELGAHNAQTVIIYYRPIIC